jgi:hypothetical protein
VQGGAVYVAEAGTGSIVRVNQDGSKDTVADNVGAPTGIAIGPDRTVYVADFLGKRIIKIDSDGQQSDFARVDDPVQLALVPAEPKANEPYVVAATVADGVVQFDQSGQSVGRKVSFPRAQAVGLATVPGGPPVAPSTTAVAPGGTTPATSGAPTTTAELVQPPGGSQPTSSSPSAPAVLAGALAVVLVLGALAAGALVVSRRGRSGFEAGFTGLDSDLSMSDAMGPCAAEEVELAESESALSQVLEQRESALKRKSEATDRVTKAATRREGARSALETLKAGKTPSELGPSFTLADLQLGTDEGRAALRAFGQEEMTGDQLKRRWDQLNELQAIAVVTRGEAEAEAGAGVAKDSGAEQTWSEARVCLLRDLETESELAQAARDVADADHDVDRLARRETQTRERIATAKEALEACRERARQAAAAAAARRAEAAAKAKPKPKQSGKQESGKQESGKQESGKQESGKQESGKQESGKVGAAAVKAAEKEASPGAQTGATPPSGKTEAGRSKAGPSELNKSRSEASGAKPGEKPPAGRSGQPDAKSAPPAPGKPDGKSASKPAPPPTAGKTAPPAPGKPDAKSAPPAPSKPDPKPAPPPAAGKPAPPASGKPDAKPAPPAPGQPDAKPDPKPAPPPAAGKPAPPAPGQPDAKPDPKPAPPSGTSDGKPDEGPRPRFL